MLVGVDIHEGGSVGMMMLFLGDRLFGSEEGACSALLLAVDHIVGIADAVRLPQLLIGGIQHAPFTGASRHQQAVLMDGVIPQKAHAFGGMRPGLQRQLIAENRHLMDLHLHLGQDPEGVGLLHHRGAVKPHLGSV